MGWRWRVRSKVMDSMMMWARKGTRQRKGRSGRTRVRRGEGGKGRARGEKRRVKKGAGQGKEDGASENC